MPIQRHSQHHPQRRLLRQQMRQRRRALTPGAQRQAARQLARQLATHPALRYAQRIARYLPADGEIDPGTLFQHLQWRHRAAFLPILDPLGRGSLLFAHWRPGMRLVPNRYRIDEPAMPRRATPVWTLDVILLPLVAFDDVGNRLGMGGGFYDRTLASLARRPRRPALLGVAHHFQRVTQLDTAEWDVPLDAVITDKPAATGRIS
ncbi:MAG: 5-formyltetrahydrofolate cyclo-ligase [Alcanivorax sp.]|nr:5-formyltetrahydrofolate cyclo-ligase [Alcanivorax sp.]